MRNLFLISGILCGIVVPYGHEYVFLIRYLLIIMLFFSFLDLKLNRNSVKQSHAYILAVVVLLPPVLFYTLRGINYDIALGAFVTALAPTAIAAPVIISLRGGEVGYVVISLVINFLAVTLAVPFILPLMLPGSREVTVSALFLPVVSTLLIPLVLAALVRFFAPRLALRMIKLRGVNFFFIVVNLYLAVSDASVYIRANTNKFSLIAVIAALSLVLCLFNFSIGRLIGGQKYAMEASQALGQKNNGFTIWLSVTYISPLAAVGPVFYILFQYAYITWELRKISKPVKPL